MDLLERRAWLTQQLESQNIPILAGGTVDRGNPGIIVVCPDGRLLSVYVTNTSETIVEMKVPKQ